MLTRNLARVLTAASVAAVLLMAPAAAVARPDQEVPFPCGEDWTGATRSTHSPSVWAIDFNRPYDLGRFAVTSGAGVVTRVEDTGERGYGKWVKVAHPDGWSTIYAHLMVPWVAVGQFVDQGVPIGRVGDTGGATAAHLHYEQRLGRDVLRAVFHDVAFAYGSRIYSQNCPDVPVTGDWDGNRADDVAVFRREASSGVFELYRSGAAPAVVRLGWPTDLPITGDWNGDGVTDVGVRRQSARLFLLRRPDGALTRIRAGYVKDLPVTGDWDGNGTTDLGVFRPGALRFRLFRADGTAEVVALGSAGAQPVTGDWDGNGVTDVGVFDTATATFRLRTVSATGQVSVSSLQVGSSTQLPVTGDWDGNGITDVGTWDPETAIFTLRVTPPRTATGAVTQSVPQVRTIVFGRTR